MAKYNIKNNFKDKYTGEFYSPDKSPVEFSKERVEEIEKVEKIIGYQLIEEIPVENPTVNDSKKNNKKLESEK